MILEASRNLLWGLPFVIIQKMMGDSYNCRQVDPMMTFLCNIDGFHLQDIPTLDFSTMDSSTPDPYMVEKVIKEWS